MDAVPNQTLYVKNLWEKLKKDEMKKMLYSLFGQFGEVIDVVVVKSEKLRGQAWIVFDNVTSATNALRSMQDFPFFGKPMKLEYARSKSDAVAKLDGTWRRDKSSRKPLVAVGYKTRAAAPAKMDVDTAVGELNSILFIENLPDATTVPMLEVLFKQFPGYREARMVPGKPGIAFIEFGDEQAATTALTGLQGFKVTPQNAIHIQYAKR